MIYAYTRLRYQVSVYRTIGPLVIIINDNYDVLENRTHKRHV